jgi:pectate lyase
VARKLALLNKLRKELRNSHALATLVVAGAVSIMGCSGAAGHPSPQAASATQSSGTTSSANSNSGTPASPSAPAGTNQGTSGGGSNSAGTSPISNAGNGQTISPSGPLPAFAGAEGAGAVSVGGRGGSVILVNNLNDSGAGSLRACIQASGPRTCIFRVAGTIAITSPLTISNPYITIAGQSAPGGGITVNGKNAPYGIVVSTHDVIMRYIRSRMGWTSAEGTQEGSPIWIGDGDCRNIIMDHVDVSWTRDENLTIWRFAGQPPIHNVTFSWSLNSEPLAGHPTSFGIGATDSATVAGISDVDVHHSLMTDASHRIPLIGIPNIRWVNNVTYNWAFYAVQMLGGVTGDYIGNYWKPGPLNDLNTHEIQSGPGGAQEMPGNPSIYVSGNLGYHVSSPSSDNWPLIAQVTGQNGSEMGALTHSDQRGTPQPALQFPIASDDVNNLEAMLVPNTAAHPAGASQRLDCEGNWVMNRDAVDLRVINNYNTGTGPLINSEGDVGGYPTIDPGVACTESLSDGIPDQWKINNNLSTTDQGLYKATAPNGFTYLENYLNGTDINTLARLSRPTAGGKSVLLADVAVEFLISRLRFPTSLVQSWVPTSLSSPRYR